MKKSYGKGMKAIFTVVAMLTIAPLVASATLVCGWPERWGGSASPLTIVVMALFGLISVPLWFTYIPATILTPWLMGRIASHRRFMTLSMPVLLLLSLLIGAVGGMCVIFPVIRMSLHDTADVALQWKMAGALSGAITLTVICLIHRLIGPGAEQASVATGRPLAQP